MADLKPTDKEATPLEDPETPKAATPTPADTLKTPAKDIPENNDESIEDAVFSIDEMKAATRNNLSKIQEEIFLKLQAFNDSPLLALDESRRWQHEHEIAFLREAEANLKETLRSLERDEERSEQQAERRAARRQQILTSGVAILGLLIAAFGLWVNKINGDVNRANAELNKATTDWNKERVLAAAQWNEPIELKLSAVEPGKVLVRNESRVEALNVEVQRMRLFYSPACKAIFYNAGHTWTQLERLAPYQGTTLELTQPFKIPKDALAQPHGTCLRRPNGDLAPDPSNTEDFAALGAKHEVVGGMGILGPSEGERLPLCSGAAPCRIIEFIRATALHAKTFERARDFDEFFLVGDNGEWIASRNLGSSISQTQAGQTTWAFKFADPTIKELFTDVAKWLKAQPRSPREGLPPRNPFLQGIWNATGVEPLAK